MEDDNKSDLFYDIDSDPKEYEKNRLQDIAEDLRSRGELERVEGGTSSPIVRRLKKYLYIAIIIILVVLICYQVSCMFLDNNDFVKFYPTLSSSKQATVLHGMELSFYGITILFLCYLISQIKYE